MRAKCDNCGFIFYYGKKDVESLYIKIPRRSGNLLDIVLDEVNPERAYTLFRTVNCPKCKAKNQITESEK